MYCKYPDPNESGKYVIHKHGCSQRPPGKGIQVAAHPSASRKDVEFQEDVRSGGGNINSISCSSCD